MGVYSLTLNAEIPALQACEIYPAIRKELVAPAVFIELASLKQEKNSGREELAQRAKF